MENTESEETRKNTVHCPDCQKEYPKPRQGKYQCSQCYVKFTIETDASIKIIPYFDEMSFSPILVMLLVLGVVLVAAMNDDFLPFMQRVNVFLLVVLIVTGTYKVVGWLCRRYRGADRFFRKISRPRFIADNASLIKLE